MKGKHKVVVKNNKLHYEFEIKRNITIIKFYLVFLQNISGYILFTDEENAFIRTEQFASAVRDSDNYFVIITRESLYNLPYSVEEIYGIHSSGKYQNTKQVYQQLVPKWKSFINYHGYIEI